MLEEPPLKPTKEQVEPDKERVAQRNGLREQKPRAGVSLESSENLVSSENNYISG